VNSPARGEVELPDGTVVCGRGRRETVTDGPPPAFGLCLGRDRGMYRPGWPLEWVDWPDFRTPRDPQAAAAAIVRLHARAVAGERVEITCGGGTGRTGTVIACLAVLAGVPGGEAVAWTRAHYRRHAVETPGQRRFVRRFAARHGPA
jgi:protein-tyrosine phosphatase